MKKYPALFCLLIFMFTVPVSCGLTGNHMDDRSLTGLWEMSPDDDPMYQDIRETVFLNLGADKKFTFYLPDYFDYGTWEAFPEDSLLRLTSARKNPFYGKKWDLHLHKMTGSTLLVTLPGAKNLRGLYRDSAHRTEHIVFPVPEQFTLVRSAVQFKTKDPFSLAYNTWRVRPDHHESCEELKKRILSHMQHLAVLFEGFSKSSSETVSYAHSPNPYILASNGVGMQSFYNVPDAYNYIFYNQQDAVTAYYLAEGFFRMKLNFPKYDKYSALWASIFNQMIQQSDTANLCGLLESRIERFRKDSALHAQQDSTALKVDSSSATNNYSRK